MRVAVAAPLTQTEPDLDKDRRRGNRSGKAHPHALAIPATGGPDAPLFEGGVPPKALAAQERGRKAGGNHREASQAERESSLRRLGVSEGYLSPARLKERKTGKTADLPRDIARADEEAPKGEPETDSPEELPLIENLGAEIPNMMPEGPMRIGSFRVQVAKERDFNVVVFDRIYEFVDDMRLSEQMSAFPAGAYWVRVCLIDLLNFQHPFSEPKRFTLKYK